MINRNINIADLSKFDFFNDARDTWNWLLRVGRDEDANALHRAEVAYWQERNERYLDDSELGDEEPQCHTCCGDGIVESVAAESGRYFWDDDGPGTCPNCKGSGKAKDCSTF